MTRASKPPQELRPIVVYPPEAVLRVGHVAAALGVSVSMVEKLDLPCVYLGPHCRRYVWGLVLDFLKRRSQ